MAEQIERRDKLATKNLHLENYQASLNNPSPFTCEQLREIIHLHGVFLSRSEGRRKEDLLKAIAEIGNLLNPESSTLNETLSSHNPCLTVDEVNADLNALQWQEDFTVQSFQRLSNHNNNNTNLEGDNEASNVVNGRRRKRVRKVKERQVFDAIHLTKPRSRNNIRKRKSLAEITSSVQFPLQLCWKS